MTIEYSNVLFECQECFISPFFYFYYIFFALVYNCSLFSSKIVERARNQRPLTRARIFCWLLYR